NHDRAVPVIPTMFSNLSRRILWSVVLKAALRSSSPANLCSIISPGSMLLSPSGTVAFKACRLSEDVASFTSPETTQARPSSSRQDVEKMVVFSLGMTLYWTVDYHLPQNQPVQLSNHLNSLLLSMCEDVAHRRPELLALLEASDQHHKNNLLPPPNRVIRQLVQDVLFLASCAVVSQLNLPMGPLLSCGFMLCISSSILMVLRALLFF
uniref:KIND domain-containing protein n=1 Tax=Pygocentrus nattereri TaxID=42514 RepID=A0AAR2JX41_PYGNA